MVSSYRRDTFIEICEQFIRLKFDVKDVGYKESIVIFLPDKLQEIFNYRNQFGTVQYMKNHVELRFYIKALEASNLIYVIHKFERGRIFKQNGNNPYYHYNSISGSYLKMMFNELLEKLEQNLGDKFKQLPTTEIPESAYALPRVKEVG